MTSPTATPGLLHATRPAQPVSSSGSPATTSTSTPGTTVTADTPTDLIDLIDLLIPGYRDLDDIDAAAARIRYATAHRPAIQARIVSTVGGLSPLTPIDLDTLSAPVPTVTDWPHTAVPLVLVDAWYLPAGDLHRPTGAVVWIRCADELVWLHDLAETGLWTLRETAEAA